MLNRDIKQSYNFTIPAFCCPLKYIMGRVAAETSADIAVDALEIFRRCNVYHVAVVENGERIGIIRAEDILNTYRFNIKELIEPSA